MKRINPDVLRQAHGAEAERVDEITRRRFARCISGELFPECVTGEPKLFAAPAVGGLFSERRPLPSWFGGGWTGQQRTMFDTAKP